MSRGFFTKKMNEMKAGRKGKPSFMKKSKSKKAGAKSKARKRKAY